MSLKILKSNNPKAKIKRVLFKDYDYLLLINKETYFIKVLNVNKHTILSINSKFVWEIRKGKAEGIKFNTSSVQRIDMKEFNKHKNKIIICKEKPYKILKYVNESEVEDISNTNMIFDIKMFNSIKETIV